MRRGIAVFACAALASTTLSGCARLQAQARVDPRTVAYYNPGWTNPTPGHADTADPKGRDCPKRLPGDSHSGAINLDCFHFPDQSGGGETAYHQAAAVSGDGKVATAARNRLGAILVGRSDEICLRELGDLIADEGIANTALTTLDSFFSTAATIVTGEQAKSILSGLAGASNTGRTTLRAEVYRNALTPAIAHAIINEREKERRELDKMYARPIETYSIDQMIVDINRYHQICSFYNGVVLVNAAVDAAKPPPDDFDKALKLLDERIATLETALPKAIDQAAAKAEIEALRTQRSQLIADRVKKLGVGK